MSTQQNYSVMRSHNWLHSKAPITHAFYCNCRRITLQRALDTPVRCNWGYRIILFMWIARERKPVTAEKGRIKSMWRNVRDDDATTGETGVEKSVF